MSFNLGITNNPVSRLGGLSAIGTYLYEDIYYRQWVTEVALAFYEGRQDTFVWLDLVKQFRNPERQQILPTNLTKEVIDEISILYQEDPVYQVVDKRTGKIIPQEQQLWEKIMEESRYISVMDRIDRWAWLLGTVLLKVSFVDESTGKLVESTKEGKIHLDVVHGGVYDLKYNTSPYYINELLIGFGNNFGGFPHENNLISVNNTINKSLNSIVGSDDIPHYNDISSPSQLGKTNKIYWSPELHSVIDDNNNRFSTKNPYGVIPAVPFFNFDPAHYYFLPINEPLIYANHAINMRITDLNHIAKFQSFGIPVLRGVERPTSLRQGRPNDDFNQLHGGLAQSKFGGVGGSGGFGAGGHFRSFDAGFGIISDGNAESNALGFSLGPDSAVAVGEKGDFKFANPGADITGLTKTIHAITDMVRINHGLRAKYKDSLPSSGFALTMEKIGVMQNNIRRSRLFAEREQQLFQVIKKLWNAHNQKHGNPRFSENSKLIVTYKQPEFPVDPKTKKEDLLMEQKIINSGDTNAIKKLYPYKSDKEIKKIISINRKDRLEEELFKAEVSNKVNEKLEGNLKTSAKNSNSFQKPVVTSKPNSNAVMDEMDKSVEESIEELGITKPKIDNRAKHSEKSSIQPNRNGDQRQQNKE